MNSQVFSNKNSAQDEIKSNLQQCFFKQSGTWYINVDQQHIAGPYPDKADAQMALMYYTVRDFWPSDKQLRAFARSGT